MIHTNFTLLNNSRLTFGLPHIPTGLTDHQYSSEFVQHRNLAINSIVGQGGSFPVLPFPEIHPYKLSYPLNSDYSIYFIGTFPPPSYFRDLPVLNALPNLMINGKTIVRPKIPFYHGNDCTLWQLLNPIFPQDITVANRNTVKDSVIQYLHQKQLNYFDVIEECQRKSYNSNDSSLFNVIPNSKGISSIMENDNDDCWLIFNTSSTFNSAGLKFDQNGNYKPSKQSFGIFLDVLIQLNFNLAFSLDGISWHSTSNNLGRIWIQSNLKYKVLFYLKVNEKIFTIVTGPSPSGAANIRLGGNSCYQRYLNGILPADYQPNINSFKSYVYRMAIAKNRNALIQLN